MTPPFPFPRHLLPALLRRIVPPRPAFRPPSRSPDGENPGPRLLPHDARPVRGHRPVGRLRRTRCLAAAQRLRCRNPNPSGPPLHRQSPQNPHLGQRLSDQHRREADLDRRRRRQPLRPRNGQPLPRTSRHPATSPTRSMPSSSPISIPTTWTACWTPQASRPSPRPTVYVSKPESDYWLSTADPQKVPPEFRQHLEGAIKLVRKVAAPYIAADRWKTFSGADLPIAGLRAVPIPGHTPGHTAYEVTSGDQSLLVIGDMVHCAAVQFPRPDVAV